MNTGTWILIIALAFVIGLFLMYEFIGTPGIDTKPAASTAPAAGERGKSTTSSMTPPKSGAAVEKTTATIIETLVLRSGMRYLIVPDSIKIWGMNIENERLRNFLGKTAKDGIRIYKHLVVNGSIPNGFMSEIGQILNPQFVANNTDELCVSCIVYNERRSSLEEADGSSSSGPPPLPVRQIKVMTGDYITTIAYLLALRNSDGVLFRIGEHLPKFALNESGRGIFSNNSAYGINGTVVGTPYNFVPLPVAIPDIPLIAGESIIRTIPMSDPAGETPKRSRFHLPSFSTRTDPCRTRNRIPVPRIVD